MSDEQQTDSPNNTDDRLADSAFMSQAEALRDIINPHFQTMSNGVINKDLKISNLTPEQQSIIVEMTDVALQCNSIGCPGFAWHLLQVRDTMLCSSSSIRGFERTTEVSTVNVHKLPPEMKDKWKIFNTRKENENQNNP